MKVTTKGRVTIPKEMREQLGLLPGAEVEFKIDGDAILIIPTRKSQHGAKELLNRMRGSATLPLSTDEIMTLTRGKE